MTKRITRKDIAEEVGVSISVVSRVINNSGYVAAEKRKMVIEAAERLGYKLNPLAAGFRLPSTKQLIFFCNDLTGAYHNQMYHGMVRTAENRGYRVLLDTRQDFEAIKKGLVDGVIFHTENVAEEYAHVVGKSYQLPTVAISYNPSLIFTKPMPSICINDREVMNKAIDYLMEKGHKKIGLVIPFKLGYAKNRFLFWKERMLLTLNERECMSYLINMNDANKENEGAKEEWPYYESCCNDFFYYNLIEEGKRAAHRFKEEGCRATALICFNDDMAYGMVGELIRMGVRIPEDISILGIDGTYIRQYFEPKLTSITTYPDRQGAKSVELLIDVIEGKPYKYINRAAMGIIEGMTVRKL